MQDLTKLKVPAGWVLERADHFGDQAFLTTASSPCYVATIDFTNRGFRSGMVVSGGLVGDNYAKRTSRKKHVGRGWAQSLVDEAVAHLNELL